MTKCLLLWKLIGNFHLALEEIGNGIGEAGIPLLSDFTIGVFGKEGGESSFTRTVGSYAGGVWIDGLGGLTRNVIELAANPNEIMEGVLETAFHPVEAWESFTKGIGEYVDETIVNGTSEDRGRVVGQLAFEALTWMIGVGEVKAAAGASKGLQKGIKVTTKLKGTAVKVRKKTLGKSKINGKLFQEKLESIVKRIKNQKGKMGEKLKKSVGVEEVGKKGSWVDDGIKGAGGAKQTIRNKFPEDIQSGKKFNYTMQGGKIYIENGAQEVDFIIDMNGNLQIGHGHSYLANGQSVQAAGTMKVNSQGVVRNITNSSGHYQPSAIQAQKYPRILSNIGIKIDNSWINISEFETSLSNYVIDKSSIYNGPIKYMPK